MDNHGSTTNQRDAEVSQLEERLKHYEEALQLIAKWDYRGNRSGESELAFKVLQSALAPEKKLTQPEREEK